MEIYGGAFFTGDDPAPWCLHARERLARRFVQLATELGAAMEGEARWSEALRLYERSLDVSAPVAEPLFQGLMRCQLAQEDGAGAARTFALLEQRLRDEQGMEPSLESRDLLQRAMQRLH